MPRDKAASEPQEGNSVCVKMIPPAGGEEKA